MVIRATQNILMELKTLVLKSAILIYNLRCLWKLLAMKNSMAYRSMQCDTLLRWNVSENIKSIVNAALLCLMKNTF